MLDKGVVCPQKSAFKLWVISLNNNYVFRLKKQSILKHNVCCFVEIMIKVFVF